MKVKTLIKKSEYHDSVTLMLVAKELTGQPGVKVLLRLDETTFEPVREKFQQMNVKPMGGDHPAAWIRETEGGRFFYTAIGHDARVLNSDFGRQHLLAALRWTAGETA